MADVNLSDPAFKAENENPQMRRGPGRPRKVIEPSSDNPNDLVKVACIVDCKPWVELPRTEIRKDEGGNDIEVAIEPERRPLEHGETAFIPAWIADILIANKHAIRV